MSTNKASHCYLLLFMNTVILHLCYTAPPFPETGNNRADTSGWLHKVATRVLYISQHIFSVSCNEAERLQQTTWDIIRWHIHCKYASNLTTIDWRKPAIHIFTVMDTVLVFALVLLCCIYSICICRNRERDKLSAPQTLQLFPTMGWQ